MTSFDLEEPIIYVDHRERTSGLIESLKEGDIFEVRERALDACDVLIGDVGIERKSGADLPRSLEDGRLFRQLIMMRRIYRRRALVLEGKSSEWRLIPHAQDGLWIKISVGLQTPILRSVDVHHTARLLRRLALQVYGFTQPQPWSSKPSDASLSFYRRLALVSFPGIGLTRAKNLLSHFASLKALFNASREELLAVPGIGAHHADLLLALINRTHTEGKEGF